MAEALAARVLGLVKDVCLLSATEDAELVTCSELQSYAALRCSPTITEDAHSVPRPKCFELSASCSFERTRLSKRVDKRHQGKAARLALVSDQDHTPCSHFPLDYLCSPQPTVNPLSPPPTHHVGRAAPPDGRGDSHFWRQSGCHRWNSCPTISLCRTVEQRSHRQDVAPTSSRVCAAELEEPPIHVACTFLPDITSLEGF